ncbi:Alg9-like mannosyltransferase family-domain-containing protein [Elsinoe ampelina]|uniref:Mannosyltransferase n=1 Tax=Elsinoe ampelina TaxID=302913 RepID=A0A6A6GQR1_9PEZI|nr:Alg9-like mannosyltransferase family-domain-containing protein [Elsinoe ampelina]
MTASDIVAVESSVNEWNMPWQVFVAFAVINTIAAVYSPIQDCDEVFNFWDPTHYLNYGYGFETWEYSPEFAIRTWVYPGLNAIIVFFGRVLAFFASKSFQFYLLRFVLGLSCAVCETRLYTEICRVLHARVGLYFAIIMITSPGMFHASVALLPSSFAMYTTMLGMASFLDWRGGPNTAWAIFWFGLGSTIGWPFAGALIAPFMLEEFIVVITAGEWQDLGIRTLYGFTRVAVAAFFQFFVDLAFYHKYVYFPWNIVKYNVLSAVSGKGPNIFGTEPWHFYIRNLLINFNLWFLIGLLAMPLLFYQEFIYRKPATKTSYIRNFTFATPMYMWLVIFTIQPHKEERFMYPIYPAIALNAALALHVSLIHLSSSGGSSVVSIIPARFRVLIAAAFTITAALLGASRTLGNVQGYGAPLSVYKPLHKPGFTHPHDTVCLGKEWYRFPSSFHLPQGVKGKFVKSAFDGLLPGHFSEAHVGGFGLFPGAWLIPPGMNDENREDLGKYTQEDHCTFFVDSSLPGVPASGLEPDRVHDTDNYEQVYCELFLDPVKTGTLARLLWVPDWDIIPEQYRRKWGKYCLLKRKGKVIPRKPGTWPPSPFTRPAPTPYPSWSLTTTPPLPYRPFRHGPKYNITMGLRPMHWDEWIELDNEYLSYHATKAARIASRGAKCCRTSVEDPRVFDGAVELCEELVSYLPARYPSLFRATGQGRMVNLATGERFDVREGELTVDGRREDPMMLAARMVQDDLAIMFEGEDGGYYLRAGAVLLAGFWRLEDKFGMGLSEIHTSGDVPGFKEKLEKGMVNFFRRIKPEAPVLRNNYFIQVDDQLAWSSSIGEEDDPNTSWDTAEANKAIEHHYFRTERQSLRRLPRSGGVAFTIRTYFQPITEIVKEPYVPGRLASAVRSWGDDVSKYKGKAKYGDVLLKYLDEKHEEQVRNGLNVEVEDEVRKYPF